MDKVNALFVLGIKKRQMKKAVEWRVSITEASRMNSRQLMMMMMIVKII